MTIFSEKDKPIFSLSEKGTKSILRIKTNGLCCEQILIDDDSVPVIFSPRCDWALRVYRGEHQEMCTFVELKGNDITHACTQILNSIEQIKQVFPKLILAKKSFVIVSGSFPRTDVQNIKNTFSKKTKTMLVVRRSSKKPEDFPL